MNDDQVNRLCAALAHVSYAIYFATIFIYFGLLQNACMSR